MSDTDKNLKLIEFAKLFKLKRLKGPEENWQFSFEWHDPGEGSRLLDEAIKLTLVKVQKSIIADLNMLALVIDERNALKLEILSNDLRLTKEKQATLLRRRIVYLSEQGDIAREIGHEFYIPDDSNLLATGNAKFDSISRDDLPFYLRGYKAIDKEISIIKNRLEQDKLLMMPEYADIKHNIGELKSDLISSQLKAASKRIEGDGPIAWVKVDITLADKISLKKIPLWTALCFGWGVGCSVRSLFVRFKRAFAPHSTVLNCVMIHRV